MTTAVAVAAVLSAGASVVSALLARQAVRRSHIPSVWGALSFGREGPNSVEVRLHNAGPGLALDVRAARVELREADPTVSWLRRRLRGSDLQMVAFDPSPRVRTLAAGEENPPDDWYTVGFRPAEDFNEPFWVAIRYRDTAGCDWELTVPAQSHEPSSPPARLRSAGRRQAWMLWRSEARKW
jgi:hypothetical protein